MEISAILMQSLRKGPKVAPWSCDHKERSITVDHIIGIEYCRFCGALGVYDIDSDSVVWDLPECLTRNQNG